MAAAQTAYLIVASYLQHLKSSGLACTVAVYTTGYFVVLVVLGVATAIGPLVSFQGSDFFISIPQKRLITYLLTPHALVTFYYMLFNTAVNPHADL